MMSSDLGIERLATIDDATAAGLADVLIDCVDGGASVSFMAPLTRQRATAFWLGLARDVETGQRIVLAARDDDGIVGTAQVILAQPENQPHRADIAKMLVHSRARRQGLGARLVRAAEDAARNAGKSVLVLDTATDGDAYRLYSRLGWTIAGTIPDYAFWPHGGLTPSTIFYRRLA